MVYVSPQGRDWSDVVNFDTLGQVYCVLTIVWTVVLGVGIGWLILHRHLYFLKMRNVLLAVASTVCLHLYLVKILLAYTTNGHFPCNAEFWIMSIYLPFGIALFQANTVQLLSVSVQQKALLGEKSSLASKNSPRTYGVRGLWTKWCGMTAVKQAQILIGIGMLSQLIVTLAIFLADRKFHSTWGSIGPSQQLSASDCRKGWEWIPSTIWQFVWAWLYGPFILYKIRKVNDVHYWRLQTTLCVIAGLPGTPLWLAALYSTQFKAVNKYWVPPMWLAPGIFMMQTATIFFPIYEAYRARSKLRKTLAAVDSWERQRGESNSDHSNSTRGNVSFGAKTSNSGGTSISGRRRGIYSTAALEQALTSNPQPLLYFAASKEFTGENIIFLVQVRDFRSAWARAISERGTVTGNVRAALFNIALNIFVTSIHIKTATFPVNIEGKIRTQLEGVFAYAVSATSQLEREGNVVDPFNRLSICSIQLQPLQSLPSPSECSVGSSKMRHDSRHTASQSQESILSSPGRNQFQGLPAVQMPVVDLRFLDIPAYFDERVFDEAERSIKYMVVTNTWPKFVDSFGQHEGLIRGSEK